MTALAAATSRLRCLLGGLLLLTTLAACVSETADLGQPPSVTMRVVQRTVQVPLQGGWRLAPSGRVRLERTVAWLADAQAVHARIDAPTPTGGEAIRRALIGIGIDPARIILGPLLQPASRPALVSLSRTFVLEGDCAGAIAPTFRRDPLPSLDSLGRCVQARNLASMLVDPAELAAPAPLAKADAAYQVDGVRARRQQRGAGLPSQNTTDDGDSGGGSYGGAGTGAAVAPGSGTSPAPATSVAPVAATPP